MSYEDKSQWGKNWDDSTDEEWCKYRQDIPEFYWPLEKLQFDHDRANPPKVKYFFSTTALFYAAF